MHTDKAVGNFQKCDNNNKQPLDLETLSGSTKSKDFPNLSARETFAATVMSEPSFDTLSPPVGDARLGRRRSDSTVLSSDLSHSKTTHQLTFLL